jgi:hypothetical protein
MTREFNNVSNRTIQKDLLQFPGGKHSSIYWKAKSMREKHGPISRSLIFICAAFLGAFPLRAQAQSAANDRSIDLSGEWRFSLDRSNSGVDDKWFTRNLTDRIKLPGILQAQGYGDEISVSTPWVAKLGTADFATDPRYLPYTKPGNVKVPFLSQPPRHYVGVAWYQRDIQIPPSWQGKRVHLLLERTRWETRAWVDDQQVGTNNSLCAPHEFELGVLSPGEHRLSVRADSSMLLPYRPDGHSVSDALGAAWNGIAGKMELNATSPVWIEDAQVFPNVEKKWALVRIKIGNMTGKAGDGTMTVGNAGSPVKWGAEGGEAEIAVSLGDSVQPWDEFHPVLQHLTLELKGPDADDQRQLTFGLREIKAVGSKFMLNGHEVDFRGTHSGGDFPLTGYPATDVESWKKIIQTCKDYGLNLIRFHSWCPPEAAFTAADELGFYIEPECGMWNPFNVGDPISKMLELETARILKAYGNHPSFLLLSPSNEPAGRWQGVLDPWTAEWYEKDPRRLYADNTGRSNLAAKQPQFAIFPFRSTPGWFGKDYSQSMKQSMQRLNLTSLPPIMTHEVGQWCSYPDFDVIKKFTGYLRPGNYEIFRDFAEQHGLLAKAKEFAQASGKFQVECYKQECEANLRTPELSGYQLLDLHDYLGQGTALIGVLDAFWQSKGYVTAEQFRRFSGPTVPLARLYDHVFRSADPFSVNVEIAHYGPDPISNATPNWRIVDLQGRTAVEGLLPARDIPIGKGISLGKVTADLSKLPAPGQYKLVVGLKGTSFENDWNFWLYPDAVNTSVPDQVLVTSTWNDAQARLAAGGKVLFTPDPTKNLDATSPTMSSQPIFWDHPMNPRGTTFLGLLIDNKNPALAGFPTEGFCDWQWIDVVRGVHAINIDKAPKELQPIVQSIDDWNRNYKLGAIFECKVGAGKLLVCAPNITSDLETHTVARQLRKSLLDYMATDKFQPTVSLTPEQADAIFPVATARPVAAPASRPALPNGQLPGDLNEGPNLPGRVR